MIENTSQKMLRHVVFFSFTDDASEADINDIGQTLMALEDSIDAIQSLEWGKNITNGQTYSHCLLVNFKSEEDLAVYADHPEHLKFIDDYKQFFEQVTEIDYWTES